MEEALAIMHVFKEHNLSPIECLPLYPLTRCVQVVDGLVAMIRNPDITSQQLMKHIPAPDFPTGK